MYLSNSYQWKQEILCSPHYTNNIIHSIWPANKQNVIIGPLTIMFD